MTSLLHEIQAAMANPATRHAMTVHLPVAMALLGVPIVLGTMFAGRRQWPFVLATLWYALAGILCRVAARSGEEAEATLSATLSDEAFQRVELHSSLGERLWLVALGVAAALAVAAWRTSVTRLGGQIVGVALSIVFGGLALVTAHHGGQLVYSHGAGVSDAALQARDQRRIVDSQSAGTDPRLDFARNQARPIVEAHCLGCHNPRRLESGLDLTTVAGALQGGEAAGAAIVPGDPESSPLIQVVRGIHPTVDRMPPDTPLDEVEIEFLERWIREGAVWSD